MSKGIEFDQQLCRPQKGTVTDFWVSGILEVYADKEKGMPNGTFPIAAMIAVRARISLECYLGTRAIARELRMSTNTVAKVLRYLADEGWLVKLEDAKYNPKNEERLYEAPRYALSVPAHLAEKFDRFITKGSTEVDEVAEEQDADEVDLQGQRHEQQHHEDDEVQPEQDNDRTKAEEDHAPMVDVPSRGFPTPEEIRARDEAEKAEKEYLDNKYTKNKYGEWVTNPVPYVEPTPETEPELTEDVLTEDALEDFRSRFGIRLGNTQDQSQLETQPQKSHLRLVS